MPNNYVFDYDASDLKATMYGQTTAGALTAVHLDTDGSVIVTGSLNQTISGHSTAESTTSLAPDNNTTAYWPTSGNAFDVSQNTMTTFAVHALTDGVAFKIQVCPTNATTASYWKDDTTSITVTEGALSTLVTKTYLKYARIAYTATEATGASFDAWYQGQK